MNRNWMVSLIVASTIGLSACLCGQRSQAPTEEQRTVSADARPQDLTSESKENNEDVYIDPKGFFRITPPAGWRVQEYPDDPRGKVAFHTPDGQTALRILAKAVNIPDYDALIKNLQVIETQIGVETNIEPTVFNGLPAVKRLATATMQGVTLKLLWVDILVDGVSHNLQYSASPDRFDTYREVAWNSMMTYKPTERDVPLSPEEVLKHQAAKWLRLAQIAVEMGKRDAAKDLVAAGLEVDPKHPELLELKRKLGME